MTKRAINKQTPPPAFRVFISSTFTDMKQYREAIQTAVNRADCVAYGMERFGAETIPPLDVCFKELENSQIYVCALGMRYGQIDKDTGKSYTQLEFERARELGKPTLVFIIDENKVSFKISEIDTDISAQKLKDFKDHIKSSKEVTCAFFDSAMALQEVAYRSIEVEKRRQGYNEETKKDDDEVYLAGARTFRNFNRRPQKYREQQVILRVRMNGVFGGWKVRDEMYDAFGVKRGDALLLNDLWVLGFDRVDVDRRCWEVDCFAEDEAADWIDNNEITQGTVFEGKFILKYEEIPEIATRRNGDADAMIAMLILKEGIRVIERDSPDVGFGIEQGMRQDFASLLSGLKNFSGD